MATGTPTTAGSNTITFDAPNASCSFTVTVGTPVSGTLGGAPNACAPITVNGTYTQNTALGAGNTVQVQITTSAVGPYSITTDTVAGIYFNTSGTSTGAAQTITLNGFGTPNATGAKTFTVKFGTSSCTFQVTINAPAATAWVPDCSTATPAGLYETNLQLNCSNTVTVDVNVTQPGAYTITTNTVNGMTFSASGTFAAAGPATVTLVGSGTPGATSGNYTFQMPGTTSCNFDVFVDVPFGPIEWSFTKSTAPAVTYKGQTDIADLQVQSGIAVFSLAGSNSDGSDNFVIQLADISGTINTGETYSSSSTGATNGAAFQYDTPRPYGCDDTYKADPTQPGVTLTFTVSSHNVATKTITGTFTGTAKNAGGQTITMTSGTFSGTCP
jgi:hypothetical protein